MKISGQNLKLAVLTLLCGGLVLFYPASVLTMTHDVMAQAPIDQHSEMPGHEGAHSSPQNNAPAPVTESEQCVTFHLNLLQDLTQSSPLSQTALVWLAATLLGVSLLSLRFVQEFLNYLQNLLLLKQQKLKPVSLAAYMSQLGNWLIIIQKNSPAYAFAIA